MCLCVFCFVVVVVVFVYLFLCREFNILLTIQVIMIIMIIMIIMTCDYKTKFEITFTWHKQVVSKKFLKWAILIFMTL